MIESAIDPVFADDAAVVKAGTGEEESKSAGAELAGSDAFEVIFVNDGQDAAADDGSAAGGAEEVDFEFELIGAAKKMADGGESGKMEKK